MTLHNRDGSNRPPRVAQAPAARLPDPLPVSVPDEAALIVRREDGTLASSEAAKALGRRGGEAKANKKRLLQGLGLANLAHDSAYKKYWDAVQGWMDAQLIETMRCGGGYIGPGVSSMIGNAGVALAASRYFSDLGAMTLEGHYFITASKLADSSKSHLLAAYELAVREGKARADFAGPNVTDVFAAALEEQNKQNSTE